MRIEDRFAKLATDKDELAGREFDIVAEARMTGWSWGEIATMLSLTRQGAMYRHKYVDNLQPLDDAIKWLELTDGRSLEDHLATVSEGHEEHHRIEWADLWREEIQRKLPEGVVLAGDKLYASPSRQYWCWEHRHDLVESVRSIDLWRISPVPF